MKYLNLIKGKQNRKYRHILYTNDELYLKFSRKRLKTKEKVEGNNRGSLKLAVLPKKEKILTNIKNEFLICSV